MPNTSLITSTTVATIGRLKDITLGTTYGNYVGDRKKFNRFRSRVRDYAQPGAAITISESDITEPEPRLKSGNTIKLKEKTTDDGKRIIAGSRNDLEQEISRLKDEEIYRKKSEETSRLKSDEVSRLKSDETSERKSEESESSRRENLKKQEEIAKKLKKRSEINSKLELKAESNLENIPTRTVIVTRRVYDEITGKMVKVKEEYQEKVKQEHAWHNNKSLINRLRHTRGGLKDFSKEGIKEKAKAIGVHAAKTVAVSAPVGTLKLGSKLTFRTAHTAFHRELYDSVEQSNNDVLKAARWAEQRAEYAIATGAKAIAPTSIYRYIKNTPYRRESKLQFKQLKNDRKTALQQVKMDKQTGINHMNGKKSNMFSRSWQRSRINRNFQKAKKAFRPKRKSMTGRSMTAQLLQGNPKGAILILAAKAAKATLKLIFKATVANPLFWKFALAGMLFFLIMAGLQACVALISPMLAGVSFLSDEDKEFHTRTYSSWETALELFVREENIRSAYPPGEADYEYRITVGAIGHDPMLLVNFLTAVYGERLDPDADDFLTQSDLEDIARDIFIAQYGVAPDDFGSLVSIDVETRSRIEYRTEDVFEGYDSNGNPIWGTQTVAVVVFYEFWILTLHLQPRNFDTTLRLFMSDDQADHFDILNLTGGGRQVLANPFEFNWLPSITSFYGYRINPTASNVVSQMHSGIDIAASTGTPLLATHTGTIVHLQTSNTGYGNMIRIRGQGLDGLVYEVTFAHMDEIYVSDGDTVTVGDVVGTVGSSGDSTGPHLHMEVLRIEQTIRRGTITIAEIQLNPLFAVMTWTDDDGNENYRPMPGTGGLLNVMPPFIPAIPPEAMEDEIFAAILTEAINHLAKPYVWGAQGPNSFDCSGFVHYVLTNAGIGWTRPRTNSQGYFNGNCQEFPHL